VSSYGLGGGGGGGLGGSSGGGSLPMWKPPSKPSLLGTIAHDVVALPEHLASDVGSAAIGFFPGLYTLGKTIATNPQDLPRLAEAIVKQYEDYYGHDVLHHLWQHPLQPILDGLTVATVGLGSAAKLGQVADIAKLANLAKRTDLITRSPEAIARGAGHTITRLSSDRPIVKLRQLAVQKVTRTLDELAHERVKGGRIGPLGQLEAKQYGRLIGDKAIQRALANSHPMRVWEKAWRKLSRDEKFALSASSMDIGPTHLKEFWGDTPNSQALTPKIHELMLNPTPKMQAAEAEARALSAAGAELLKSRGRLSAESELDRPGRFKAQVEASLGHPIDSLHGDPYYMPHTLDSAFRRGSHPYEQVGGGKAEPKELGSTRQNQGELFSQGKLDLHNDVLGAEFLRRVKWLKFWEIHEGLKRGAVRMTWEELHSVYGGRAPVGHDFLRTSVPHIDPKTGKATMRKQKIQPSIRGEGKQKLVYDPSQIPDPTDLQTSALSKGFTTDDLALAAKDNAGRYYIVPKATARAATGEFTRMNDFMYRWVRQPLRIWRALLLGLRPAFLVNNLIGNSLMYTMKTGGKGAVRDLFMAMRESHGDQIAKRLLDDPSTPRDVRLDLYREFFPEQMSGTMGLTQSPSTEGLLRGATSAVGKGFEKATGALPTLTSKIAEEGFRRGLIRNFIRNSPEFRAVYESMPRETRSFETAARKLLSGKGGERYQRLVSEQVDRSLGNYTRLSPLERNGLRNLLPFYAWYRAILKTTLHLGIDNPLRAQFLFRLGQIGTETMMNQAGMLPLPSYLQGSIPLGLGPKGTRRVLSTQSLNPWATLSQLGRGITDDLTSLGINPFVIGGLEAYKKLASGPGGTTRPVSVQAWLGEMMKTIVTGLPPYAQVFPKGPSKLYPNRGYLSALEAWAGAPIKELNPVIAAQYAAAGQ
jgi:hypothetical protein